MLNKALKEAKRIDWAWATNACPFDSRRRKRKSTADLTCSIKKRASTLKRGVDDLQRVTSSFDDVNHDLN